MLVQGVFLCLCAVYVGSYPSGAPASTCGDMVPQHGTPPQTSASPFTVSPAVRSVSSGNKIRLMLDSPEGLAFAGFMLQARSTEQPGDPIGVFTNTPDFAQVITCGSGIKNTVTHRDRTKKKSLEMEWEAPQDFEGPVTFNSTFVQDGGTFWVGVESGDVQVVKRSVDSPDASFGISTTRTPVRITTTPNYSIEPDEKAEGPSDPIYDGCGSNKLCFGIPVGCIDTKDCDMMTVVFVRGDTYQFELQANKGNPKWVSLGLSQDASMGDESVMECSVINPGKPDVYMSYNEKKENNRRISSLKDTLKLLNSSYANGKLYCQFTRDTVTTVEGRQYDLVSDQYFLLLAAGTNFKTSGEVQFHDIDKKASAAATTLSDVGAVAVSSDVLYRIHGALMITSWIGCASVGILLARYFKGTWVGSQMCGKDQWFAWHRTFMVTVWTLTCAAFVVIFVQIQGWYGENNNPHAILGCITTGLAFIQPFGALLRPMPDSPKRPIFNWLHWLVGNCAHILAIVTIFFAVKLSKAQLPEWTDWVLVAFVAFHVFMHLLFSVMGCFSERKAEKMVNDFPLKDMGSSRSPLHNMERKRDAPHSCLRKFLLAIYLLIIAAFTVVLILMVVMAPVEETWAYKEIKKLVEQI